MDSWESFAGNEFLGRRLSDAKLSNPLQEAMWAQKSEVPQSIGKGYPSGWGRYTNPARWGSPFAVLSILLVNASEAVLWQVLMHFWGVESTAKSSF